MVGLPERWRARVTALLTVLLGAYLGALAVDRSRIVVRGQSMAPTLLEGDVVLTVPVVGRWLQPGQVVVLTDPADAEHLVIKRVHAIEAGQVLVLGDDPHRSTDSRVWGWVAVGLVRRRVLVRWPDVRSPLRRVHPAASADQAAGRVAGTAGKAAVPAAGKAAGKAAGAAAQGADLTPDQPTGRRASTSTSGSSSATSPSARRP